MPSLMFSIEGDLKAYVTETAAATRTTEVDVIQRSVEAFRYLDAIRKEDGRVVFRRKNGKLVKLVRF